MVDSTPGGPSSVEDQMRNRARKIGHDLNNCLGVVGGRAELALIQLERGNAEAVRSGVQAILDQMDKMNALADSLRHLGESG